MTCHIKISYLCCIHDHVSPLRWLHESKSKIKYAHSINTSYWMVWISKSLAPIWCKHHHDDLSQFSISHVFSSWTNHGTRGKEKGSTWVFNIQSINILVLHSIYIGSYLDYYIYYMLQNTTHMLLYFYIKA